MATRDVEWFEQTLRYMSDRAFEALQVAIAIELQRRYNLRKLDEETS